MRDQAALLRELAAVPRVVTEPLSEGPPTIVIASGKGGVGKSVMSVLFAHSLSQQGHRVLLLEGAQNLGSLHVLLGVRPRERLETLFHGEASPSDLLTPVTDDLWLLAGDSGAESLYALGAVDRARLHHRLNSLYDRFDVVVIDAGSGLDSVVRVASMRATHMIVLTIPEPPALIDAYAMIKIVHVQVPTLPMAILVNCEEDPGSAESAYQKLATACQRFLSFEPESLGAVPLDPDVRAAVRAPGKLIELPRETPAVRAIDGVVCGRSDLWPVQELRRGEAPCPR